MKNEKIRLNPFVYISETDIRFYLLVSIGIIMPLYFNISYLFGMFKSYGIDIDLFFRFFIGITIFFLILLIICLIYRRLPGKKIKQLKLKNFNKSDHCKCINELHDKYLSNMKLPTLVYQPKDTSIDAFTFGTKKQLYIYIPGGLVRKFRSNINAFESIFLHEMGHIMNKDVEKAYLAISTWKSFLITLFLPFGIPILLQVNLIIAKIFLLIVSAFFTDVVIWPKPLELNFYLYFFIYLYVIIFLMIIYILRNQIIRLREFYADARILEWEKSPNRLIKTLKENGGKERSKFDILYKFHPNYNERIKVLENNLILFTPNLWVAFTLGFFYLELRDKFLFSIANVLGSMPSGYVYNLIDLFSFFVFTILMFAVSSSFHKSILRDVFIGKRRYFSSNTILNIIKFSLVFSFGLLTANIFDTLYTLPLYETYELIEHLLFFALFFISDFIHFALVLIFLAVFSSMLLQRSFSKKDADKNFFLITTFSSSLFIVYSRYYIDEAILLKFLFFFLFSVLAYFFIKIKDKRLSCPKCNYKLINLSELNFNCPNCQYDLYSWAIYSF